MFEYTSTIQNCSVKGEKQKQIVCEGWESKHFCWVKKIFLSDRKIKIPFFLNKTFAFKKHIKVYSQ